jgi:hypothetical protein
LILVSARYLQRVAAVAALTAGCGRSRRQPFLVVAFFGENADERAEAGRRLA